MKQKIQLLYLVMSDDCNEGECDCILESPDSIWDDKKLAEKRCKEVYKGRIISLNLNNRWLK